MFIIPGTWQVCLSSLPSKVLMWLCLMWVYCWCCYICLIKTNFCRVLSSSKQMDSTDNNLFLIADFNDYLLINSCHFSLNVHVRSFIHSFISITATDCIKGLFCHLLMAWSGHRWVGVLCCMRSAACRSLEAAWLLLSLLLLWLLLDNEPLAQSYCHSGRQTGLRPGHCRLMPSGSLHWEGRTGACHWEDTGGGKVTHTLAYWLAYCLTDWLGFVVFKGLGFFKNASDI